MTHRPGRCTFDKNCKKDEHIGSGSSRKPSSMAPRVIGDTSTPTTTISSECYGSITLTNSSISDSSRNEEEAPVILDPEAAPLLWVNDQPRKHKTETRTAASSCRLFVLTVLALACGGALFLVWYPNSDDESNIGQAQQVLLSPLDPNTGMLTIIRQSDALPSKLWGRVNRSSQRQLPLPTNSWYLNLLSHRAAEQPDESTRVYTIPYVVDTAATFHAVSETSATTTKTNAGIRVHWPVTQASNNNIQMVYDYKNGLNLGSISDPDLAEGSYSVVSADDNRIEPLSPLGVALEWNSTSTTDSMRTYIVRGMPYATMQFYGKTIRPTIFSYNGPASPVLIDDEGDEGSPRELECGVMKDNDGKITTSNSALDNNRVVTTTESSMLVQQKIKLHFMNSDFTWLVVFSHPVRVVCEVSSEDDEKLRKFQLQVVDNSDEDDTHANVLTVRLALLDACTTGQSDMAQHCDDKKTAEEVRSYEQILTRYASTIPTRPKIDFDYPGNSQKGQQVAHWTVDWGAQTTSAAQIYDTSQKQKEKQLLMFALPHHQALLGLNNTTPNSNTVEMIDHCYTTFHGNTCLVSGNRWQLSEDLENFSVAFTAARPPVADMIPDLASALSNDIHYRLSANLLKGAADTYFSGKILARVARVIVIADELASLASSSSSKIPRKTITNKYTDVDDGTLLLSEKAAKSVELPSQADIAAAVEQLKHGVDIWLSSNSEAPYVYDESWGGIVNCGCTYVGKGELGVCNNTFPVCPALLDVNEDFGNGYYNDHHYHYGYHLYAAAVVAKFDPDWGRNSFDKVLLHYVRDFANPFEDDEYFIQFRHKDWFLGSSWASGIVSAENSPHGRNEESSSEAIAAYEAMALYGTVMVEIFGETAEGHDDRESLARLVKNAGQLLMATELRAANLYWHVWSSKSHMNTYPGAYKQPVVGMLYDTMATFQTWFAPQAVVSYGIQLMPLTGVAELRDDPDWAAELYPIYKRSCKEAGKFCVDNGWSILQAGLCATSGDREDALKQALSISPEVFASQGGVGNSLTNTIWFISTRKSSPFRK